MGTEQDNFESWKATQNNLAAIISRAVDVAAEHLAAEKRREQQCSTPQDPREKGLKEVRNEVYLTAHVVRALSAALRFPDDRRGPGCSTLDLGFESVKLVALRARQAELELELEKGAPCSSSTKVK
jgi:hypothetical protein